MQIVCQQSEAEVSVAAFQGLPALEEAASLGLVSVIPLLPDQCESAAAKVASCCLMPFSVNLGQPWTATWAEEDSDLLMSYVEPGHTHAFLLPSFHRWVIQQA